MIIQLLATGILIATDVQILNPKDLGSIVQRYLGQNRNEQDEISQCPEMVQYFLENKEAFASVMSEPQLETFFKTIQALTVPEVGLGVYRVFEGLIAFALSRNINIDDPKVRETLLVLQVGLGSSITEDLIKCKSWMQAEYLFSNYFHGEDFHVGIAPPKLLGVKDWNVMFKFFRRKTRNLFVGGLSTQNKDSVKEILSNLLQGISTITLKPVTAHGTKNIFPLGAYIHDIFHHYSINKILIGNLEKWFSNTISKSLENGNKLKDILPKTTEEAIRRYKNVMQALSDFLESSSKTDNCKTIEGALFYLFHEGGTEALKAEDWDNADNIPQFLENWIKRIVHDQQIQQASWTSPLDPFHSDPKTGNINATEEQLLIYARQLLPEYKAIKDSEKCLLTDLEESGRKEIAQEEQSAFEMIGNPHNVNTTIWENLEQNCRRRIEYQEQEFRIFIQNLFHKNVYLNLIKANHELDKIQITLQGLKDGTKEEPVRFVLANVDRGGLEPDTISVYTTLYHKCQNARDTYLIFGGKKAGLKDPATCETREEAIYTLTDLYQKKIPQSMEILLEALKTNV